MRFRSTVDHPLLGGLIYTDGLGKEAYGLSGAELVWRVQMRRALHDDKGFFAQSEAGVQHLQRIPGVALRYAISKRFFAH